MLPPADTAFLEERRIQYTVHQEGGMVCVVFPDWRVPPGYQQEKADLLVRLPPGYPDMPPDMWWFDPALIRLDGTRAPATEVTEQHLGRQWQRWSRHFPNANSWRSGVDGLESYLTRIRSNVASFATRAAA